MLTPLIECKDYYTLADGRVVFTEKYHLARGFCCANGCLHCPYDYINIPEPQRSYYRTLHKLNETNSER